MAERIVVLGYGGACIELHSALDAGAFVESGTLRVSLTKWSGPLANATVLCPSQARVNEVRRLLRCDDERAYRRVFKDILAMPLAGSTQFTIDGMIPVGGASPTVPADARLSAV